MRPLRCSEIGLKRSPVKLGKALAQGRVSDHHKVPALAVGAAGGLSGDLQATLDHLGFHRSFQVEPLTHRARRGQQMVNDGEVKHSVSLAW